MSQDKYRIVHKDRLLARKRKAYHDNRDELIYQMRNRPLDVTMFRNAKSRAKEKGLDFNIEMVDIVIPEFCPLSGIPLFKGEGGHTRNSPTLDRLDNSKGYIKGNVHVISFWANGVKHDASFEEFETIYLNWKRIVESK